MMKKTLYDELGVSRDATQEEIREAFRRLARQYHPDRFTGAAKKEAEARFQRITEAFNTLSRPDLRKKYDQELDAGTDEIVRDPKLIAKKLAAKGAQLLSQSRVPEAIEALQQAVHHDPEFAKAHYLLGKALASIPSRRREGLRHLEKACQLDGHNPKILIAAARAFMLAGMHARARRFASEALKLDPGNPEAQAILSAGDQSQHKGGGILGLIKKK